MQQTLFAGVHPAKPLATEPTCVESVLEFPSGQRCCGSSMRCARAGWSWSSQRVASTSSFRPRSTFNALVTGAPQELLTADTGCPKHVPDGFSSRDWESRGWPYGICFTLTASEWKEGNYVMRHLEKAGRRKMRNRAAFTLGNVPTVCQAEFIQGFPRGSLHSSEPGMQCRLPSPNGLVGASSPPKEG